MQYIYIVIDTLGLRCSVAALLASHFILFVSHSLWYVMTWHKAVQHKKGGGKASNPLWHNFCSVKQFFILIQASKQNTTHQLSIMTCVNATILLPKRKIRLQRYYFYFVITSYFLGFYYIRSLHILHKALVVLPKLSLF